MSDEKQEVSLLDQFKQQHAGFVMQRDQAQVNLQQLVGAIYACELMIKKLEEQEAQKSDGGQGDGEAIKQEQEQAA